MVMVVGARRKRPRFAIVSAGRGMGKTSLSPSGHLAENVGGCLAAVLRNVGRAGRQFSRLFLGGAFFAHLEQAPAAAAGLIGRVVVGRLSSIFRFLHGRV